MMHQTLLFEDSQELLETCFSVTGTTKQAPKEDPRMVEGSLEAHFDQTVPFLYLLVQVITAKVLNMCLGQHI